MWIEIVDKNGVSIGAVNSEACDLIRIDSNDPRKAEGGALIRNVQSDNEVYKTRISYLRLIETLTQTEIQNLANINEIIKDIKDEPDAPRIVIPGQNNYGGKR